MCLGYQASLLTYRIEGAHPLEHATGLGCGQSTGHSTWTQQDQHRVEAAHCLGSQAGELEMTFSQHPQHLGMVLPAYQCQTGLTQRGDRYRPGIVGIVLLGLPRRQHPHPGRQHRRHIKHLFTLGHQLLGE